MQLKLSKMLNKLKFIMNCSGARSRRDHHVCLLQSQFTTHCHLPQPNKQLSFGSASAGKYHWGRGTSREVEEETWLKEESILEIACQTSFSLAGLQNQRGEKETE